MLRIIDTLLSLIGVIFCLPVMFTIYIIGFFDTGSPLFFQVRVGRNQKIFTLIKFRTMYVNTCSIDTHLVDHTSITRFGDFLRKTKMDELPQLFNVLLGHMSLVGPRPSLSSQRELIEERNQRGVFKVRPGITGLAQINGIDMSTPRKLARYDALMINSMTLRLYAKLIISTILGQGHGDRVKDYTSAQKNT